MKKNKLFNIVAVICIILLCTGLCIKALQNDTFYSIKIGEFIVKHGIDMKDHYSFISNLPYTYPHWLFDTLVYLIFNYLGYTGLHIFNIICYSIIGIILYFSSNKITKNYVISFILSIMSIGFLVSFITTRAQIISFIIFILEEIFIYKFLDNPNKKNGFILLLLSTILVNVHLAVWIFYYLLFLPPIVSTIINKIIKKDSINNISISKYKNINKLLIVIILSLFTGLITPLGLTPYTYIVKQFQGDTLSSIAEYAKLTISNGFSFYQYIAIYLILILFCKGKLKLDDLFLMIGISIMSLISIRSMSYVFILGIFPLSNYISTIKINKNIINKLDIVFNKKIELIVILICFIVASGIYLFLNSKLDYVNENLYPIEATKFLKKELKEDDKLFNSYEVGAYLLYNDIKVFIDSRSDLYTTPFNNRDRDIYNDYMDVLFNYNYKEVFEHYDVSHILLYIDSNKHLIDLLQNDKDYKVIYVDNNYVVLKKELAKN